MPNRVIREGLLHSQRYWSVHIEARQLFWHLMLLADDFGLVSLAPVFIRRMAFIDAPPQSKIDRLIGELERVDLLRTYEVEGVRYGFIPRFRQILRIEHARHPLPPHALFEDDRHAAEKFHKNKDKFEKLHSRRVADARHPQRTCLPEVESEVEVETKRREVEEKKPVDKVPNGNGKTIHERAAELGLTQNPGEAPALFAARVATATGRARSARGGS